MEGRKSVRVDYNYNLMSRAQACFPGGLPVDAPPKKCGEDTCVVDVWCGGCVRCRPHCHCGCNHRRCDYGKDCKYCGGCERHCRCSPPSEDGNPSLILPHDLPYPMMVRGLPSVVLKAGSKYGVLEEEGKLVLTLGEIAFRVLAMSQMPVRHFLFGRVNSQSCYIDPADDELIEGVWKLIVDLKVSLVDPYNGSASHGTENIGGLIVDGPTAVPARGEVSEVLQRSLPGWTCHSTFSSPFSHKGIGGNEYAIIMPPARPRIILNGWQAIASDGRALLERSAGRNRGLSDGTHGRVIYTSAKGREVVISLEEFKTNATHVIMEDALAQCALEKGGGPPLIVGHDRGAVLATRDKCVRDKVTQPDGYTIVALGEVDRGDETLRYYQPYQMSHLADSELRKFAMRNAGTTVDEEEIAAQTRVNSLQLRDCLTRRASGMAPAPRTGCYISGKLASDRTVMHVRMHGRELGELLGSALVVRDGMLEYADGTGASMVVSGNRGHISTGEMDFKTAIKWSRGVEFN